MCRSSARIGPGAFACAPGPCAGRARARDRNEFEAARDQVRRQPARLARRCAAFRRWLAVEDEMQNVVVVGGGRVVDALRELDRRQPMPAEVSHRLAIQAMSLTAELVAQRMNEATKVAKLEQLRLSTPCGVQILEVEQFMSEDSGSANALPAGWHVTSDSIAARIAKILMRRGIGALEIDPAPWRPESRSVVAQRVCRPLFRPCGRRASRLRRQLARRVSTDRSRVTVANVITQAHDASAIVCTPRTNCTPLPSSP